MQRESHSGCNHRSPVDRDGYRSDLEDWFHDEQLRELDSALATPLVEDDRCVGTLTVYDHGDRRFTDAERRTLARFASLLAWAVKHEASGGDLSLTDPSTGVANGRFLWLEASQRIVQAEQASGRFGLLAFRVLGVERVTEQHGPEVSERMVGRVARRFAAAREEGDAVVRFGPDLFVVLTSARESSELIARWHSLALEIEQPMAITPHGPIHHVRLRAAHAIFPENGETVEALLEFLDGQLAGSGNSRNVVPFRVRAAAPRI
jgi:diguanylate cyclase (GGDEF)-like protein